jgi:hypothetical protein
MIISRLNLILQHSTFLSFEHILKNLLLMLFGTLINLRDFIEF